MEQEKEECCVAFGKKRAVFTSAEEDMEYWSHQVKVFSKKLTNFTQNDSNNINFRILQEQLHEANECLKEARKYHLALIKARQNTHSYDKEAIGIEDTNKLWWSDRPTKKRKLNPSRVPFEDLHEKWWDRVQTEYDILLKTTLLPEGIICQDFQMEKSTGQCIGMFGCLVPFRKGSNALDLIPLIKLKISTPHTPVTEGNRRTGYPFVQPKITIAEGKLYLPSHCIVKSSRPQSEEPSLLIPILQNWQETDTILNVLEEFVSVVQENDPAPVQTSRAPSPSNTTVDRASQEYSTESLRPSQEYSFTQDSTITPQRRLRLSEVHGNIYTANELDSLGNFKEKAILVQDGSMILLCPTIVVGSDHGEDYFEILEEITLQELENIKPHQDKSVTFTFNDHMKIPRTFFLREKESFLEELRDILSSLSSARTSSSEDTTGNSTTSCRPGAELLKDLLSLLPPKQAETTQKLVDKVGTYAEAIAKFWRGDG